MPVSKVQIHPPRDFEVESVEIKDGNITEVKPVTVGRNAYTTVCHVVLKMDDGTNRAGKIEVNPDNGEMRITRLNKPGEKKAKPRDPNNPDGPPKPGTAVAGPMTARPDVVAAEAKANPPAPAAPPKAQDPMAKTGGKQ